MARRRDLDILRAGFARWLPTLRPEAAGARLGPLRRATSGWSSETLFADVIWETAGGEEEQPLVLRLPPAGQGLFPDYDLSRQERVQAALAATSVPVAKPLALELDEERIGEQFLVMERVTGFTLPDAPSYAAEGPLHEAGEASQSAVQRELMRQLASIHLLPWEQLGLGFLTPAEERGLAHDIDRAEAYLGWACDGSPPAILTEALEWCRANRPAPEPPVGLVWGDARLGNVVFRGKDLRIRALLDWEMASVSPAELDLAWFLALHAAIVGRDADLPGFRPEPDAVAIYEGFLGRPVTGHRFFTVLALVRSESVWLRICRLLMADGLDEPWLRATTPGQRRLAELLRLSSTG